MEINFPVQDARYIEGDNHLVIGYYPLHRIPDSAVPTFIEKTNDLEAIRLEGGQVPLIPHIPYTCIEALVKSMGSKVKPIPEYGPNGNETDYFLKKHGFPLELVGVFFGLKPFLSQALVSPQDGAEWIKVIISSIETGTITHEDLDVDSAISNFNGVLNELMEPGKLSKDGVIGFCETFALYKQMIRDYEFIQPYMIEFRKEHEGKICAVVSDLHADLISEMLEGKPMQELPSWDEYKKQQSSEVSDAIDLIEDFVAE